MSILDDYENMTASQIDQKKCEEEKKLLEAQDNLHKVEIEELELGKQIINLQSKRKDLQISASKAKQIVRELAANVRILTSKFWRARDNR
jgi:hypothetical protein